MRPTFARADVLLRGERYAGRGADVFAGGDAVLGATLAGLDRAIVAGRSLVYIERARGDEPPAADWEAVREGTTREVAYGLYRLKAPAAA